MAGTQRQSMFARMQRLRYAGMSPLAHTIAEKSQIVASSKSVAVMTAWGSKIDNEQNQAFRSPFSTEAAMKIAEVLATKLTPNIGTSPNMVFAAVAGQLTATWAAPNANTIEDQRAAMRQITSASSTVVPTESQVRAVVSYIFDIAKEKQESDTWYSADQVRRELGVVGDADFTLHIPNDGVSEQKLAMVKLGVNGIQSHLLSASAGRTLFEQLRVVDDTVIDLTVIPDIIVASDNDRRAAWSLVNADGMTAFYHALGMSEYKHTVGKGLSYLIMCILQLTKGSNVTDDYMARRLITIGREFTNIQLEQYLDRDKVMAYGSLFPTSRVTADQVFRILQIFYSVWKEYQIGPLAWIIEQSATSNSTSAIAVAEMIVKHSSAPFYQLAEMFGTDQFQRWATLAGNLVYDRFCPIVSPPIPVAEYPDLGYLGISVTIGATKPGVAGGGYQGTPDQRARMPKSTLDKLVVTIVNSATAAAEDASSILTHVRAAHPDHLVVEVDDEFFLVPKTEITQANASEVHNALRADWPKALRTKVPGGTFRLSYAEAAKKVRQVGTPGVVDFYKHINTVATALIVAARQEPLTLLGANRINETQRRVKLADSMVTALQGLGVTVPDEWTQDPPAIEPKNALDNQFINQFVRTWWPNFEPIQPKGPRRTRLVKPGDVVPTLKSKPTTSQQPESGGAPPVIPRLKLIMPSKTSANPDYTQEQNDDIMAEMYRLGLRFVPPLPKGDIVTVYQNLLQPRMGEDVEDTTMYGKLIDLLVSLYDDTHNGVFKQILFILAAKRDGDLTYSETLNDITTTDGTTTTYDVSTDLNDYLELLSEARQAIDTILVASK